MLKEITAFVDNGIATLTEGTNLFAGHFEPDTPDSIVVVETLVPGIADPLLADKWAVPIRVMARSASFFSARGSAQAVFDLLHGEHQISLPVVASGPTYLCNVTGTTPAYIGKDEKGRHMFVSNYVFLSQQV